MPDETLTFPFVDLDSRMPPDRLDRLAQVDSRIRQAPSRDLTVREIAGWLSRAQDATGGGGMAGFYHLQTGWSAVCPEAGTAALTTMLSLSKNQPNGDMLQRAIRLGLSPANQRASNGNKTPTAILSENISAEAWAILGWIALFESTSDLRFKTMAVETGQQLVKCRENETNGGAFALPHKSIAAWALIRLTRLWPDEMFSTTAETYGDSVLAQTGPVGYPRGSDRSNNSDSALIQITHSLYGLLEAGILAGQRRWIGAAQRGAERLLRLYREKGTLAGRYESDWQPNYSFNCMAGCAQTALLWFRLYQNGSSDEYFEAASRLNDFIASTVDTTNPDPGIRGGIRAGYPLWVDYYPLAFWALAAKLALDAFLLEEKLTPTPIRRLQLKKPAASKKT